MTSDIFLSENKHKFTCKVGGCSNCTGHIRGWWCLACSCGEASSLCAECCETKARERKLAHTDKMEYLSFFIIHTHSSDWYQEFIDFLEVSPYLYIINYIKLICAKHPVTLYCTVLYCMLTVPCTVVYTIIQYNILSCTECVYHTVCPLYTASLIGHP